MSPSILTRLAGKVVRFSINQQITQATTQNIAKAIENTKFIPTLAYFVTINSPGGSLTQARNIAALLRSNALNQSIPMYCFAEDQCLGSANVILTSGSKCYAASEFGLIGDFGYSWSSINLKKWHQKYQLKRQKASTGKNQPSSYDIFQEISPETAEFTQNHLNILAAELRQTIKANRSKNITLLKNKNKDIEQKINTNIFDKPLIFGQDMIDHGLLDQISTPEQVMNEHFSGYKIKHINKSHPFDKWRYRMEMGMGGKLGEKLGEIYSQNIYNGRLP